MRRTTQDQVSISVALRLRLYFQMKEKYSQTKSCTYKTTQAQTQQFLPCCHCMKWLNCNKKLIMSPKRALSSLVSPPPHPLPFPPPPLAQDQLTRPKKTVFFSTLRVKKAEQSRSTSMAEETIRVAVTLTLRTA